MKLAIFGATGATGRHLVEQALQAGHEVTALARNASSLPGVHIVTGNLSQPEAMQSVVQGADVVISVLGMRSGDPTPVCSNGMQSILQAMNAAGTQRLIALSAYGALESAQDSVFIRLIRKIIASKMRDKDAMEVLVRHSGMRWTLVRPPMLSNGAQTGRYRVGTDLQPGLTSKLSRADLAAFILQEAVSGQFTGQAPVVSA